MLGNKVKIIGYFHSLPIDQTDSLLDLDIVDYSEHAMGHGGNVQAAAYVEAKTDDGRTVFGVGIDTDVATASVRALLGAANAL